MYSATYATTYLPMCYNIYAESKNFIPAWHPVGDAKNSSFAKFGVDRFGGLGGLWWHTCTSTTPSSTIRRDSAYNGQGHLAESRTTVLSTFILTSQLHVMRNSGAFKS